MNRQKFKTSMLEYGKIILGKMAFDRKLFRKEYRKILRLLAPNEQQELKFWIRKPEPQPRSVRLILGPSPEGEG